MNARGTYLRASLPGRLRHDARRKLAVFTGGNQHAVTRCRRERHGHDDFRVIRHTNPLSKVRPSPVEDELTFAVFLEVRGRYRDEPIASPKGQVGWGPARISSDAPGFLEHVQPRMLDEGRRFVSDKRVPGLGIDVAHPLEDPKSVGYVCAGGIHVGRGRQSWHAPSEAASRSARIRPSATMHAGAVRRQVVRFLSAYVLLFSSIGVLTLSACGGAPAARPRASRVATTAALAIGNVARADYSGSEACAACHPTEFAAWDHSPMHRMTRDVRGAEVHAPFDGTRWRFKGDAVVLERRGDDPWIRIEPARGDAKAYRIVRVIGGRTREDFTGVEERGGEELVLPVSYVFATGLLRYKGYSVMVHERDGLRAGPSWRSSCIFCHNTIPEIDRLLGAIAGSPVSRYQSEQVDRWLPPERRAQVRVTDSKTFELAAASEAARLGGNLSGADGSPQAVARAALGVVRSNFDGDSLVEVGIGCEACHGGAREHSQNPDIPPSFVPRASWLDVALPMPTRANEINRVCARCHQVLFTRYPFTWEGGRRDHAPGGSHINSGEARDFLLGACSGAMACTACHDPHNGGPGPRARELAHMGDNAICTACHEKFADPARLRAHAHHDPERRGGSCLACHMPRKNMGLEGSLIPYHRIGSPTDPDRVLGDRPLECALCHSDRTVRSLVDAMQAWWPVRYPVQRLEELYGSLDANVIRATLERGKPHEQVVAIATLGEMHAKDATARIASKLLSDYPLVREWAKRALVTIRGHCDVDLSADDAAIARQAGECGAENMAVPAQASPTDEPSED
jgi:predicted CXXCH cytochrome family protein